MDGLFNFRDTGGTPLADGGVTRSGVLYRSDALSALTDVGLEELAASPIGVIADFRTTMEQQMAPDRIPAGRPIDVQTMSLLEGAMTGMAQQAMQSASASGAGASDTAAAADGGARAEAIAAAMSELPTLGELYVGMLEHGAASFAQVARLVAASTDAAPTAVLVHCTAGKDRTGVATALLLDAVGADRSAVVADYAASGANLAGPWAEGMYAMVQRMGAPLTPQLKELVTATPPEAIEQALAWVDERGGSAEYLQSGGLTDDERAALSARLIAGD